MNEYSRFVPCPLCGTNEHVIRVIEDIPSEAVRVYCRCTVCGLRSAGVIFTKGAMARSPDNFDIVSDIAASDWDDLVSHIQERGEI